MMIISHTACCALYRLPEKFIRKRFAKAVSKGKVDMKISMATQCPIGGLIEKAVMEVRSFTFT